MKNVLYSILFAITAILCSCCESYTPIQKSAIEIVKGNCIAPSTFQLVSILENEYPEEVVRYDTIYYYNGCKVYRNTYLKDSIKVIKKTIPAYTVVVVEFDAQNAFGATLRKSSDVVFVDGLYVRHASDFPIKTEVTYCGRLIHTDCESEKQ